MGCYPTSDDPDSPKYADGIFFKKHSVFSKQVVQLGKPLALGIFGIAASQINNALDAVFARWASEEGPAVLWYAIRLQQLPLALFGIAISGALLPPLARAVKKGDYPHFEKFLDFSLKNSIVLMLPITFFFLVLGEPCVHLLFGHGDFSYSSIIETSHALWGYAGGLLPMTLILVIAPAFYARNDYRTPSMAAGLSMILNIFLNFMMIAVLGWGAASVATATSISAWFNFVWLALAMTNENQKQGVGLLTSSLLKFALKTSCLSVGSALLCLLLLRISFSSPLKEMVQLGGGVLIFGVLCLPLFLRMRHLVLVK